jgi:hypothetical protein
MPSFEVEALFAGTLALGKRKEQQLATFEPNTTA